jgi:DNA processing protein
MTAQPGPGPAPTAAAGPTEEAWLAALVGLPDMFPSRLAALFGLRRRGRGPTAPPPARSAEHVWDWLCEGDPLADSRLRRRCGADPDAVVARWRAAARRHGWVETQWHRYRAAGVAIHLLGGPGYPAALAADGQAPYVLYTAGSPHAFDGARVAIVGTRRCSAAGRDTALSFGRELSEAGVRVVSGLALGIDAAAHAGALAAQGAPPVGVVAGGLDRPYPARHGALWRAVAGAGVLLSEAPLATPSEAWRFPARNRIIAALADVVVVVESHGGGGSIITAEHALARSVPVMAVPGPIRAPSSVGTNRLLSSGAIPALDTADVLTALALRRPGAPPLLPPQGPPRLRLGSMPEVGTAERVVLEAVDWGPTPTETIVCRTGLAPAVVAAALTTLEMEGHVRGSSGWWERVG